MAPNAGDRHFRVFRVPASVFQVPVGGDGRPLADVLRGERAPMDALHRRPEAACPNVWQRIGVSEHDGRQAGAGPGCVLSSCYRPVWREFSFRKSGRF